MSTGHPKSSLEDFALRGLHLGKMTGISAGIHAVPDAYMLMHSGVGCKYKAAAQIAQHDWAEHANRREAWTQVAELSLVRGASERIGPFARSWYARRRPNLMVITSAYFIELTGEDNSEAIEDVRRTLPCDVELIETAAPNGGFFDGYTAVMEAVLKNTAWDRRPSARNHAAVAGFFFHRYEPDQRADLGQLAGLLKAAGLRMGPVLFSGKPYTDLTGAHRSDVVLALPYLHPVRDAVDFGDRRVVPLHLPIGLAGTARFVRALTEATGGRADVAEAWIAKQREAVLPQVGHLARGFQRMRVALYADTPLAAGIASFLRELGMELSTIGLRDGDVNGGEAFLRATLAADGLSLNADCEVVSRPSLRQVRRHALEGAADGTVQLVMGSSHELDVLFHAPRHLGLGQRLRTLEVGFPSRNHHSTVAAPILGFTGAAAFAQRILDAVLAPQPGSSLHA